jgi:hypothetical protein
VDHGADVGIGVHRIAAPELARLGQHQLDESVGDLSTTRMRHRGASSRVLVALRRQLAGLVEVGIP